VGRERLKISGVESFLLASLAAVGGLIFAIGFH
jgi:hypothetical protein